MKQLTILALASSLAFAAMAQDGAGVIDGVKGAVTVSSAKAVQRAVDGMAVPDGASILVPSDGAATLLLNNGCVVSMQGSQHLKVNAKLKCEEVQASVKQLFPAYKVAQAPLGGGLVGIPAGGSSDNKAGAAPGFSGGGAAGIGLTALTSVAFLHDWNRRDSHALSGQ